MLATTVLLLGSGIMSAYTNSNFLIPTPETVTRNNVHRSMAPTDTDQHASRIPSNMYFDRGNYPGKQEYGNPIRYRTVTEGRDRLNESQFGPPPMNRNAIDPENLKKLIHVQYNLEVHPKLDPLRQDISKGRKRRRQSSFYYNSGH